MATLSFLDREHSVAPPNYNRWLIPPAALAIHLCIGQVYAFSVFKIPFMSRFDAGEVSIGWIFSIAILMLGASFAASAQTIPAWSDALTQNPSPGPLEELGAQLLLQRRDLVAHRRLRDEALLRRAGEAAVIGHRDEVLELPEFHTTIV